MQTTDSLEVRHTRFFGRFASATLAGLVLLLGVMAATFVAMTVERRALVRGDAVNLAYEQVLGAPALPEVVKPDGVFDAVYADPSETRKREIIAALNSEISCNYSTMSDAGVLKLDFSSSEMSFATNVLKGAGWWVYTDHRGFIVVRPRQEAKDAAAEKVLSTK